MHKLWQEVGLLRDREIVDLDDLDRVRGPGRARVTFWRDLDRLEAHLCELSPADADAHQGMLKDAAAARRPRTCPPTCRRAS